MSIFQRLRSPAAQPAPSCAVIELLAAGQAPAISAYAPALQLDFVAAPATRRQLLCLALSIGAIARERSAALILHGRLREAALLIPTPPVGLARALGRLGERAWSPEGYAALLQALACPAAAKVLWHAERLTEDQVRGLAALPPILRENGLCRLNLGAAQSAAVADAWRVLMARGEAEAPEIVARRLGQAKNASALVFGFERESGPAPAQGPALPAPFRPVLSRAQAHELGSRYGNCLTTGGVQPDCAYYEWRGTPGVVVELQRDPLVGWRLQQARTARNRPTPETARLAITAALTQSGVAVGRGRWQVIDDLWAVLSPASAAQVSTDQRVADELFGVVPRRRRRRN